MLSTFCSLVVAAVAALFAYLLADFIFEKCIVLKIYTYTMTRAGDFLSENGRGFFEDKNMDALSEEWAVRIALTLAYQLAWVVMALLFVPYKYSFWVVSGLAIKIGIMIGLVLNLVMNVIIEYVHVAQIGRLIRIDENGMGYFRGTYCDDFEVDLSWWNNPEERPPLDKRYLVLDVLDNTGFEMLDFA